LDFSALNSACRDTFGTTVTHVPQVGPEQELIAIVDDPVQLGDQVLPGVLMVVSAPIVAFNTSAMRNDTIRIAAAEYRVFAKAEDSGGMVHLSLTA
jgi:hypothetical protein